mmetsp:Transcript_39929/g.118895  ORF Transcript_39929/g.118895 Transcript_39929/m.118895 type:complete len:277 (+) Transcript_39929:1338-2168(+)
MLLLEHVLQQRRVVEHDGGLDDAVQVRKAGAVLQVLALPEYVKQRCNVARLHYRLSNAVPLEGGCACDHLGNLFQVADLWCWKIHTSLRLFILAGSCLLIVVGHMPAHLCVWMLVFPLDLFDLLPDEVAATLFLETDGNVRIHVRVMPVDNRGLSRALVYVFLAYLVDQQRLAVAVLADNDQPVRLGLLQVLHADMPGALVHPVAFNIQAVDLCAEVGRAAERRRARLRATPRRSAPLHRSARASARPQAGGRVMLENTTIGTTNAAGSGRQEALQ